MNLFDKLVFTDVRDGFPHATIPGAGGKTYHVYDCRVGFPDTYPLDGVPYLKTGFIVHHDAVAFSGADQDFNGTTINESISRIRAVYNYHVSLDWGGVGYHSMGDLEGRLYIFGDMDQSRAHTSSNTRDTAGSLRGSPPVGLSWNGLKWGHCIMGHYSDKMLPDGTPVLPGLDRPTAPALGAMDALFRYITENLSSFSMDIAPHKAYQLKECPGDWAEATAWQGFKYSPVVVAPTPAPTPAPAPAPGGTGTGNAIVSVRQIRAQLESIRLDAVTAQAAAEHALRELGGA